MLSSFFLNLGRSFRETLVFGWRSQKWRKILRRVSGCLGKSTLSRSGVHVQRSLNMSFSFWKYVNWKQDWKQWEPALGCRECVRLVQPQEGQGRRWGSGPPPARECCSVPSCVVSDENYEQSPGESAIHPEKGCECSRLNSSAFQACLALTSLSHLFPFSVSWELWVPCPSAPVPPQVPLPYPHASCPMLLGFVLLRNSGSQLWEKTVRNRIIQEKSQTYLTQCQISYLDNLHKPI